MSDTLTAALLGLAGVLVTAILAPRWKQHLDQRREKDTDRAAVKAAQIAVDAQRESWWREELETLRRTWQDELTSARNTHNHEIQALQREQERMREAMHSLERAVAEYAYGLRVAEGFVLVPSPDWAAIRARLPDLPVRLYPGEHSPDPPPAGT